jgi:hypothetical protein
MPWGGFDNLAGHHCNTFPPSTGVYGFSLAFLHLVWAFPPSTLSVLLHWTSVSLWRHRTSVDFFSFLRFLLLLLSASLPRGLSLDFDPGTWQWNIDTRSGSFEPHMSGILGLWFRRREAMAWRLVVTDDGGSLMDAAPDHLAAAAGVAAWLWLAGSRWPCRPWFACI